MTGFGLGEVDADGLVVRVEIRSVNHRFLQARFRLPSEFADLEPAVDKLVKQSLSRGSVTLTVNVSRAATPSTVVIDHELAARYVEKLGELGRSLDIENDLELSDLATLPGVIADRQDRSAHERETQTLLSAVGAALANLVEMRETEGESMEADIRKNAAEIASLQGSIDARMPDVVKAHFEAMKKRAEDLLGDDTKIDPKDLARELAVISERADVSEEISRLASHLEQLDKVLATGGEIGRKLDFLVQELYREANTIGSKCGDATVSHAVVDLKTHIERVREQVQNIE